MLLRYTFQTISNGRAIANNAAPLCRQLLAATSRNRIASVRSNSSTGFAAVSKHLYTTATPSPQPLQSAASASSSNPAAAGGSSGRWKKPTAEGAVTQIISRLQPSVKNPKFRPHVFNCFMEDEPGILTRATGIMAARGYNIDSVVVSKTEIPGLSRMTISLLGEDKVIEQAKRQLEDLTQVWAVVDLSNAKVVEREVLLVKLSTLGQDYVDTMTRSNFGAEGGVTPRQPIKGGNAAAAVATSNDVDVVEELHINPYEQVLESSRNLSYIRSLSKLFDAKIVDVGADCAIVELCAKSDRIDAFMKLVEPFGVLEAARTGRMVMSRTAKLSLFAEDSAEENAFEKEEVDLSALPPS
ncbi:acetolactate synthase, regulatory subunit [Mycoemilia scoparia]|uniref:Acetolactate synthase, regulatory subunit n=1 Tax=Mycoemilia scoparia TaxID=417184 RepID=A0A9W7ZRA1_9FUNG|nr:acetolactate synthase, regulatory subunit [Mycoemilia scoparia]